MTEEQYKKACDLQQKIARLESWIRLYEDYLESKKKERANPMDHAKYKGIEIQRPAYIELRFFTDNKGSFSLSVPGEHVIINFRNMEGLKIELNLLKEEFRLL